MLLGSEYLGNSMTRLSGKGLAQTVRVEGVMLGSFVTLRHIPTPIFIKMDVEGAEEIILRDLAFFERYKPTLYLSLHPFWFSNPEEGLETIRRVAALYKHCTDEHFRPTEITPDSRYLLLTDFE